jgi:hypothetical protein
MLKKLVTIATMAMIAMTYLAAPQAIANIRDAQDITVKQVVFRFVEKDQLRELCGARARACAYTNANVIVLPQDDAYGWTGTRTARVQVVWHTKQSLREIRDLGGKNCNSKYACVVNDVVHAINLSFEHRGLVWLGEAYAEAIGLEYNPRRVELLAHELKHVLTGERDNYSPSNQNYRIWKASMQS